MANILRTMINTFKTIPVSSSQVVQVAQRRFATEKSLNQVFLLGRVGTDPMVKGSEETPVVVFSLATNVNKPDDDGGFTQRADWHRISVFKNSLRRICMDHVKKGSRIFVQGRISYHAVTTEDNTTNKYFSIVADDLIMCQSVEKLDKSEMSQHSAE